MKLPLKITVELFEHVNEVPYYSTTIEIPGNSASATCALIKLHEQDQPEVVRVQQNGLVSLCDSTRDELLTELFQLAYSEMVVQDGTAIEWSISNIAKFLTRRFGCIAASEIQFTLGDFTDALLPVRDVTVVRDD